MDVNNDYDDDEFENFEDVYSPDSSPASTTSSEAEALVSGLNESPPRPQEYLGQRDTLGEKVISFDVDREPTLGDILIMHVPGKDEKVVYKSNPSFLNDITTYLNTEPSLKDAYNFNPYPKGKSSISSYTGKETTAAEAIAAAKLWLFEHYTDADKTVYNKVATFVDNVNDNGDPWKNLDFDGDTAQGFFEKTIKGNAGWEPKKEVTAKQFPTSNKGEIIDKLTALKDSIDVQQKQSKVSKPQKDAIDAVIIELQKPDIAYDAKQLNDIKKNVDKLSSQYKGDILYPKSMFGSLKKDPFTQNELYNFIINKNLSTRFGFGGKSKRLHKKSGKKYAKKTKRSSNRKNKTKRRK
jgi:hypothetical protein